jgi:hypothetical protein
MKHTSQLTQPNLNLAQSIVASLTPTDGRIEVDSKADLRAFSTYSDDEKNVTCKYGERPDYGYGTVSHDFLLDSFLIVQSSRRVR